MSVVNLIDMFLVITAILMVQVVANPLNPYTRDNVTVIENPGSPEMRITIKEGTELTRYEASGEIGEGQGVRAGTTYQMDDGRMIYVPEQ